MYTVEQQKQKQNILTFNATLYNLLFLTQTNRMPSLTKNLLNNKLKFQL